MQLEMHKVRKNLIIIFHVVFLIRIFSLWKWNCVLNMRRIRQKSDFFSLIFAGHRAQLSANYRFCFEIMSWDFSSAAHAAYQACDWQHN